MRITRPRPRGAIAVLAALLAAMVVSACGSSSASGGSGSSSKTASKNASVTTTTSTTAGTGTAARTAFTTCLKAHGVRLSRSSFGGFGGRGRGRGAGTVPKVPANGTSTSSSGPGVPSGGAPSGGAPSGGAPSGGPPSGGFPGAGSLAGGNSKFAKAFQACRSKLGSSGFGGRFGAGAGGARPGGAGGNFRPRFTIAALKSYVACIRRNGYAAMPEPKASSTGSFFPASIEKEAKFLAANKKCESVLLKAVRRPATDAGSGGGTFTTSGTSTTSSA